MEETAAEESPAAAPAAPPGCCLAVGKVWSGRLDAAGVSRVGVDLAPGELLEAWLPQEAADLVIEVIDPAGTVRMRLDSPLDRPEPERLVYLAEVGGRHVVEIESLPSTPDAPYRLDVRALRPATAGDRLLARAVARRAGAHELRRGGRFDEAIRAYRAAARAWSALDASADEADALRWAAHCLARTGRQAEAEEVLRGVVAAVRGGEDPAELASALGALGAVLRDLGRIEEAVEVYEEALGISHRIGDRAHEAATLIRLANLEKARYQMGAAELRYKEALALWRELGRPRDEAVTLGNLAGIYGLAGDTDLARDLLLKALATLPETADDADRGFLHGELGLVYRRRGERERAIRAYERALSLAEGRSPIAEMTALHGLGLLHDEADEHARAEARFRPALAIAERTGERLWQGLLLQNLGWSALHQGELDTALSLFRRALSIVEEVELVAGEVTTLTGIGRVERARGNLEAAAVWAERAVDAAEEVRAGSDRAGMRAGLLAARRGAFDFAVETFAALDRQRPGKGFGRRAFEAGERARARWLLDALPEERGAGSPAPEEVAQGDRLAPLRSRVQRAEAERLRRLADGATPRDLARTERELRDALEALRAARRSIDGADGAGFKPHALPEIQRSLPPEALLLSVHLGEERSHLFAVSAEGLSILDLAGRAELEELARRAHRELSTSDRRGAGRRAELAAAELSRALLGPAVGSIDRHREIVFALDGALHAVPIGALPHPRSGEPLLDGHRVRAVPSASVGVRLAGRTGVGLGGAGPLVAVVADPVYGRKDERARSAGTTGDVDAQGRGLPLERLRFAAREAEAVLALVPAERRLLRGDFEARKGRITSGELARFPIVHFAVHGLLNAQHPELSALVLSRVDPAGLPRDGYLWAHEIAELDLPAELVVASACDSGLGPAIGGEGLVGLSHAFFRAGAKRALVSLWPVADAAAPELMERFYAGLLQEGLPPAEALRRAQLAIRSEPRWERPYFWAGWVLQGAD